MRVTVYSDNGERLWEHRIENGQRTGMSCQAYVVDGTQERILEILTDAVCEACFDLRLGLKSQYVRTKLSQRPVRLTSDKGRRAQRREESAVR